MLQNADINVTIGWITAHAGITNNEEADREAKRMAASVAKGHTEADESISMSATKKLAVDISTALWQSRWERALHGESTKVLIPRVSIKTSFPTDRCTGISYIRLLLDDTNLRADQWRDKFVDSPYCQCDTEVETSYHYLMDCPLYEEIRNGMHNSILRLWDNTNCPGNLSITMETLIGTCDGKGYPK